MVKGWALAVAVTTSTLGCVSPTGPDITGPPPPPPPPIRTHDPVWVTASWSGGRTGSPLDSRGVTPTQYFGRLCAANSLILDNYGRGFNGLYIHNNCTAFVNYAICVAAGSGNPGSLQNVPTCAVDPMDTRQLAGQPLEGGGFTYVSATRSLTVNFFWCSDQTILAPAGSRGSKITCAER